MITNLRMEALVGDGSLTQLTEVGSVLINLIGLVLVLGPGSQSVVAGGFLVLLVEIVGGVVAVLVLPGLNISAVNEGPRRFHSQCMVKACTKALALLSIKT